nr:MAG TPA: hypothetical protein [Caudoviricetes sp.]
MAQRHTSCQPGHLYQSPTFTTFLYIFYYYKIANSYSNYFLLFIIYIKSLIVLFENCPRFLLFIS